MTTELLTRLEEKSKNLEAYTNNLDSLLGIKTEVNNISTSLTLVGNELWIRDTGLDWYIVDKSPTENLFKVVGISKSNSSNIVVFLLGNLSSTDGPFLLPLDPKYLDTQDLKKCLKKSSTKTRNWSIPAIPIIGIMVSLVVGVNLIGPITKSVSAIQSSPGTSSAVSALAGILPIIFVAVIIVLAMAFVGGNNDY